MKWKICACALTGLSSCAVAYAQSSVTLYGLVDEGINYTTHVATAGGSKSQYAMVSGVHEGNRWGLLGKEDLGGGTSALFRLESGFDLNTGKLGQGGLMFGRQAYVGLSGRAGTVTAGRQYDVNGDLVQTMSAHQWAGYIGSQPGDIDNFNKGFRVNNAIKYRSPNLGGITFEGMYSFGGVAGDFTRNQLISFGAQYVSGGFKVAAGYLNSRNPNVSFFGNNTSGTPLASTSNSLAAPIYGGFVSAHTYQVIGAGSQYVAGPVTLGVVYTNVRFSNLGDTANSGPNPLRYSGSTYFNNGEINVLYGVTPSLFLGAAVNYVRGGAASRANGENPGASYKQATLGVDYFLSKRTDVYVVSVFQKASGTNSQNVPAVAQILGASPSSGSTQLVARVGLRHKF